MLTMIMPNLCQPASSAGSLTEAETGAALREVVGGRWRTEAPGIGSFSAVRRD